jgi:hypothetical protein
VLAGQVAAERDHDGGVQIGAFGVRSYGAFSISAAGLFIGDDAGYSCAAYYARGMRKNSR